MKLLLVDILQTNLNLIKGLMNRFQISYNINRRVS